MEKIRAENRNSDRVTPRAASNPTVSTLRGAWCLLSCGLLGCGALLDLPDDPRLAEPASPSVDVSSDSTGNARPPFSDDVSGAEGSDPTVALGEAEGPRPAGPASSADEAPSAPDAGSASIGPLGFDAGADAPTTSSEGSPGDGASVCGPIERDLISDFTFVPGADQRLVTFDADASFAGGTFIYPDDGTLASDVTADDWHLSGVIASVSGFGVVSSVCQLLDASAYAGIEFRLSGQLPGEDVLTFFVETASNRVSHVWLNENKPSPDDPDVAPNSGRCTPLASRYDGTCREARLLLPVSQTPALVRVFWADLVGGSPAATVDPREITSIAWSFRNPNATPYEVDLRIDDLRFIAPL